MTSSKLLALDNTGLEIHEGDRVGSFRRIEPGTAVGIHELGGVLVLHDGDEDPTIYMVGPRFTTAPGLFLLNTQEKAA